MLLLLMALGVGSSLAVFIWSPLWVKIAVGVAFAAVLLWLVSVIHEALREYWRDQDGVT